MSDSPARLALVPPIVYSHVRVLVDREAALGTEKQSERLLVHQTLKRLVALRPTLREMVDRISSLWILGFMLAGMWGAGVYSWGLFAG